MHDSIVNIADKDQGWNWSQDQGERTLSISPISGEFRRAGFFSEEACGHPCRNLSLVKESKSELLAKGLEEVINMVVK